MARGFDSKSVEEQQSAFAARSSEDRSHPAPITAEEGERKRQQELLMLSRKQVVAQLEAATAPRHREMLENALAELDERLAQTQKDGAS
ncbi:MAG TPA: hypothetical protein VM056_04695 [Terriglobales bacterium]|nr:hypothetical protein [Terriglobales bacterium]